MSPPEARAPRLGTGAAAGNISKDNTPPNSRPPRLKQACASPRFRHLVRHLHLLGPRPLGELLLELGQVHHIEVDVAWRLERMAELDPATVAALGGRDWPRVPLELV